MAQITITFPDELVAPMRALLKNEGETDEEAVLRNLLIRCGQVELDNYVKAQEQAFKQNAEQQYQAHQQDLKNQAIALEQKWGVGS